MKNSKTSSENPSSRPLKKLKTFITGLDDLNILLDRFTKNNTLSFLTRFPEELELKRLKLNLEQRFVGPKTR
jgi:hypothetical protein